MKRMHRPNQQTKDAGLDPGRTEVRPYGAQAEVRPDGAQARAAGTIAEQAPAAATISEEERQIDQTLADSFPASDPPPWTLGMTQPREEKGDERGNGLL